MHGQWWVVMGRPKKKGNAAGPRRIVTFLFIQKKKSKGLNGFDQNILPVLKK
jgi:hypothetical protein